MSMLRARVAFVALVAASSLAAACSAEFALGRDSIDSPTSHGGATLCQPFPDRLIDDFIAAYNDRDLNALKRIVVDERIEDVVAAAYSDTSRSAGVEEWARAGWNADDRMRLIGYGAFYPTKRGFQMYVVRRSSVLADQGITGVASTLDAISRGCRIESLAMSGIVQARKTPCAFYAAFRTVPAVAENEPAACRDGSGNHARTGHAAAWTGARALVWGGHRGGLFTRLDVAADGVSFDPTVGEWQPISEPSVPLFVPAVGAWTGEELLVLGTTIRGFDVVGAAYDPASRSWRTIPFPNTRWSGFSGVWTGKELIVWGGPDHSAHPRRRGAIYEPSTDSWRKTSPSPIAGRWSHSAVWTGTEMIVWGGTNATTDLADGAAYDPATDTWRKLSPAPLSARQWLPLVWTGREVVVWGGSSYSRSRADGAAYDPVTDSWRTLPRAPLRPRHHHSATWSGSEVIVFGGHNYHRALRDGAAYDPVTGSWRRIQRAPIHARCCHTALWTGTEIFVFGGTDDLGGMAHGDGALYDPAHDRWRRVVPFFDVD
jgi:hypothetical protein